MEHASRGPAAGGRRGPCCSAAGVAAGGAPGARERRCRRRLSSGPLLQALPENVTPGGRPAAGGWPELPETRGQLCYFESCCLPIFRICCRICCRRRAPRILAAAAVYRDMAPSAKDRRPEGRRACRVSYIDICCSAGGSAGGHRLPSSVFRICCRRPLLSSGSAAELAPRICCRRCRRPYRGYIISVRARCRKWK